MKEVDVFRYRFACLLQPLSDQEHYVEEEHNKEFDHEAFLGKEEVKTFEDLTPDESKDRLRYVRSKLCFDQLHSFELAKMFIFV